MSVSSLPDARKGCGQDGRAAPAGRRRRGLTIVELTVVMAVVGVVLALTVSVYRHAVRLSRQTACLSNMRQLAVALNTYYTKYQRLPSDDAPDRFEAALLPFVKDKAVFHCPADARKDAASYAPYYVHRREMNPQDFMLGCPLHAGGQVGTVLFGSAGAEGNRLGTVTHNNTAVKVGERVVGGVLRFADGSVASMTEGTSVDIITSFERGDGSYYHILRIPVGASGIAGLEVNPNSRLEVITPAAIAGSEGTRFYVEVLVDGGGQCASVVDVRRGKAGMKTRGNLPGKQLVQAGEAYRGERPSGRIKKCDPLNSANLPWLPYRDDTYYGKATDPIGGGT